MIPSIILAYAFHDIPQTHLKERRSVSDINFNEYDNDAFQTLR